MPTIAHLVVETLWEGQDIAYDKHCHTRHTAKYSLHLPWSRTHDNDSSSICDATACRYSKDILESSSPLHHSSTPCLVFWVALFQIFPPKILFHILQSDQEWCYTIETTQSHFVIKNLILDLTPTRV